MNTRNTMQKVFTKKSLKQKMWSDKGEEELKKVIEDFKKNFN